jgi:hypothetical protein
MERKIRKNTDFENSKLIIKMSITGKLKLDFEQLL